MALTEEDKQWLGAQLGGIKTRLDSVETRVDSLDNKLNQHFSDFNQRFSDLNQHFSDFNQRFSDLNQRFSDVDNKLATFETWFRQLLAEAETRLTEHIDERTHDLETRLLRAFSDYQNNANIRFRKLEADQSNLDTSSTLRLGELERQMADLTAQVILLQSRIK